MCVADVQQVSTAELAARAEETREQLQHLDRQVGVSVEQLAKTPAVTAVASWM